MISMPDLVGCFETSQIAAEENGSRGDAEFEGMFNCPLRNLRASA